MKCHQYQHRVQYYETDQMGIVHHSNYIKWFESARNEYLRKQGISCRELEKLGVLLPVIEVNSSYKQRTYYDDLVTIRVFVKGLSRVTITFGYEIKKGEELLVAGSTKQSFVNRDFKPVSLQREKPKIWEIICGDY
ncbi:acyl-CoA thioesterase [Orenia marismortui]|uniref:Acyl-CoA thioester hydrolase n=1 Tax=Orenia marismortui TaxID=46469 RepID=A0A4V3GYB0_9FIRM|nr:thioesterase family protein [Orenia marismortui]TDX51403.1 acyl-CoA thioester hydrolase [Orenia marismortui]